MSIPDEEPLTRLHVEDESDEMVGDPQEMDPDELAGNSLPEQIERQLDGSYDFADADDFEVQQEIASGYEVLPEHELPF